MGCVGCNSNNSNMNNYVKCDCDKDDCYYRFKVPCKKNMPHNGNGGQVQRTGEIYLATDESIANGQFMGLGTASALFTRNTVVIPENAIITGLVFNIRDNILTAGEVASAEIVISQTCGFDDPVSTGVIATVTGPNNATTRNCCGTTAANYPVNRCTLLSVRVTTSSGALPNGAAATILYRLP